MTKKVHFVTKSGHLRAHIRARDAGLNEPVPKSCDLAAQAGRKEQRKEIPVRDWNLGTHVIDRVDGMEKRRYLPTILVRESMLLLQESRLLQERFQDSAQRGSLDRTFTAEKMKMNRRFIRFFRNKSRSLSPDRAARALRESPSAESLKDGVSVTGVAVPHDGRPRVDKKRVHLRSPAVISDIVTLKSGLRHSMRKTGDGPSCAATLHPFFGPDTEIPSGNVMHLSDCGDEESLSASRTSSEEMSGTLEKVPTAQHELLTSYTLGLSHIIHIVFPHPPSSSGITVRGLEEVVTTISVHHSAPTAPVMAEGPFSCCPIQSPNTFAPHLHRHVKETAEELAEPIRSDGQLFEVTENGKGFLPKTTTRAIR